MDVGEGRRHRSPPTAPAVRHAAFASVSSNGARSTPPQPDEAVGKVVLFDDTYANYMEPNVGLSAVELLEGCGYEVILARAGCCQRPRLSKGLVRAAKRDGTQDHAELGRVCSPGAADPLPGAVLRLGLGRRPARLDRRRRAWAARGRCVKMIDVFLDEEVPAGRIPPLAVDASGRGFVMHGHCHQNAEFGTAAIHNHFQRVSDAEFAEVDSGCCGMAGSFGYEHYDVSRQVGEDRLFPAVRQAVAGGQDRHRLRHQLPAPIARYAPSPRQALGRNRPAG